MKVNINNLDIEVEVIIKRTNRNIYFRIRDNKLIITTPYKLSEEKIYSLINQNLKYFEKHLSNNNLETNNEIHIFGKPYKVNIIESNNNYCEIENENLNIYTTLNEKKNIQFSVDLFLSKLLKNYIDLIKHDVYLDFCDIVRQEPKISYKNITTYYGKCYFLRNEIVLNINLARYDKLYIKSVLYHEYCHFKYHDHQDGFYSLYNDRFKDAKKIQHDLKKIKYKDLY